MFRYGIRQTPLRQNKIDQLIEDPKSLGHEVYRNYTRNLNLIDLEYTPDRIKQKIQNVYNSYTVPKQNILNYLMENRCRLLIEDLNDFL